MKPFSESCVQNQEPILAILTQVFASAQNVLEIGSGTGQHAVFFGRQLPHLRWQTSDLPENHPGILAWLAEERLPNVLPPLAINALDVSWPIAQVDSVFSANAVHIMSWPAVEGMFRGIGQVLEEKGTLALYGPFNYGGKFTSDSNARFDLWLKSHNPESGVRDFEAVNALAESQGLKLLQDFPMPANNRTLVWRR
ncbi:MAG: DUF938 domain-containing protein [Bdellovibrionota bacterium]